MRRRRRGWAKCCWNRASSRMPCRGWKRPTAPARTTEPRGPGAAYVFTQQLDKALPLLEQAVAAEPGNYDVRMMYARALRDRRQFPPAARQFYEAAKLKPAEPHPWTELGDMLYLSGDFPQSLVAFENAQKAAKPRPATGSSGPSFWTSCTR